jgi:membrane carboxypeptidase/penicillin-binding protein PbpC
MLGCLEYWWLGGIYSPNHQNSRWGGLLSMGAPDTLRCVSHVTQPLGFWRFRLLELWHLGAPDSHCSLSGAPSGAALTLHELSVHYSAFAGVRWSGPLHWSRCSAGTLDSPVTHQTVRWIIAERLSRNPKVKSSACTVPGAPDTVRWHIGQSGAQDQGSLRFLCSFLFEPWLWFLYWFVLNLWLL